MRRLLYVMTALAFSAGVSAQPPTFAGTWTLESSRGALPGGTGGGMAGGMSATGGAARAGAGGGSATAGGATAGGATASGGATAGGGGGGMAGGGRVGGTMGGTMGGGGAAGSSLVISQTATTLTIERHLGDAVQVRTYKLDGSESENRYGMVSSVTRSRWEGDTLVTVGTQTVTTTQGDVSTSLRETIALGADGLLRIETTRERDGTAMRPSIQTYAKKK
ncbi:MAG: hypothetical protein R2752_19425 [Vicinamibacterales bacterium]